MRAAVCHRFKEPLAVEEVQLDAPAADEVSVQVSACGVCHSDIAYMDGAWGGDLPAVYGHEVAGVVSDVGPDVESVTRGDHVVVTLVRTCRRCFYCLRGEPTQCEGTFAIDQRSPIKFPNGTPVKQAMRVGGFAESVTVHSSQAIPIPSDVSLASACLLACAVATGVGAVRNTARVEAGASVAVVGAGGVGMNSIQGAAIAGADKIIAIDVSESRLAQARGFGATDTVNSRNDTAAGEVRSLTGGRGPDYTLITTGNPAAIQFGLGLSRRSGTTVIVGITGSGVTIPFDPGHLADSGSHVMGCKMGSIRPQVDIPELVELYRTGKLKLDELVTGRFGLDEVNEAVAATRRGEGLRAVIVF